MKKLEMVHFQLTNGCNLNCWFCGQRKNMAWKYSMDQAMKLDDWIHVIDELDNNSIFPTKPVIMLWGGEPLTYSDVDKVLLYLHEKKFKVGMVTNGTLLREHINPCANSLSQLYVSIDGPAEIHNSIRGNNAFEDAMYGVCMLKEKAPNLNVACNTVVTDKLLPYMDGFFEVMSKTPINKILLQNMIGLNDSEIIQYKQMAKKYFNVNANAIDAWKNSNIEMFDDIIKDKIESCQNQYPFSICYKIHNRDYKQGVCNSPNKHLHIMWNGETSFCTDFTDISLGNVKTEPISDIFCGDKATTFRRLVNSCEVITCKHCSWIDKEDYKDL